MLCAGLLVYNGELSNGNGDFMGVAMREGRVEFKFDVGSGPATIQSEPVPLNEWHTIRIKRTERDGETRALRCWRGKMPPSQSASQCLGQNSTPSRSYLVQDKCKYLWSNIPEWCVVFPLPPGSSP